MIERGFDNARRGHEPMSKLKTLCHLGIWNQLSFENSIKNYLGFEERPLMVQEQDGTQRLVVCAEQRRVHNWKQKGILLPLPNSENR